MVYKEAHKVEREKWWRGHRRGIGVERFGGGFDQHTLYSGVKFSNNESFAIVNSKSIDVEALSSVPRDDSSR